MTAHQKARKESNGETLGFGVTMIYTINNDRACRASREYVDTCLGGGQRFTCNLSECLRATCELGTAVTVSDAILITMIKMRQAT